MILPTDKANTAAGKWLIFISLLVLAVSLCHMALGTDSSGYALFGVIAFTIGCSFRIASNLEGV